MSITPTLLHRIKQKKKKIRTGHRSTKHNDRRGRPTEGVTPEKKKGGSKIVFVFRQLKLRKIADIVTISEDSGHTILNENLGMRKLCANWVPRLLTFDQKRQCVEDSEG